MPALSAQVQLIDFFHVKCVELKNVQFVLWLGGFGQKYVNYDYYCYIDYRMPALSAQVQLIDFFHVKFVELKNVQFVLWLGGFGQKYINYGDYCCTANRQNA